MSNVIRIGNAQAFWGDRSAAAAELLQREPEIDYLTMDYLAEVSMSILARQRERDPEAGYARDFVDVVRSLAPYWAAGGQCRLLTNAGGLNPAGCAAVCRSALQEAGCRNLKIAYVTGDDVLDFLLNADHSQTGFANLDTGEPLSSVKDRLITANAYLGAAPLVEALTAGADIVITGRVADPSLTLAPCMYQFEWAPDDWERLAGGTVAGHLIECGTQVTGGISTDWLEIPDPAHIGFPIAEVSSDGSCVITKASGTGGVVSTMTVCEQLVYEIGDPGQYLSPDVIVSFHGLNVEELGQDRVRVTGAQGQPPPQTLKVSATYRDGYRAAGTLTIYGRNAAGKARRLGEIVLQRLRDAGYEFRESLVECLSAGDCAAGLNPPLDESQLIETVLRVAVASDSADAVNQFTRELMPLITAGPPGTTGYAEGRPRVQPVFRYWPCLIDRDRINPRVELLDVPASNVSPQTWDALAASTQPETLSPDSHDGASVPTSPRTLRDLAHARSGDKGINANVGVIARLSGDYQFLQEWLTAERVQDYFRPMGVESVERYELPNLQAVNFILCGVLRSKLRTDSQGKTLGEALLEMRIPD